MLDPVLCSSWDVPAAIAAVLGCAVLTGGKAVLNAAQATPDDAVAVVGLGGVELAAVLVSGRRRPPWFVPAGVPTLSWKVEVLPAATRDERRGRPTTMSVDRGELKRPSLQRRAHGSKAPRALTSGAARRLREAMSKDEGDVVMPKPVAGTPPFLPSALGEAALRALASEQPRELTPDEVYRMMTPLPSDDGGWAEELAEDRRTTTTDDPWSDQ